ncbi:MAG: hypothetical protein NC394_02270 [Bacteroides sp.]|nr:hypothetical protein [Bacteroides sp.]
MYAYNRSNVAYDLSQFDTDGQTRRQPKPSRDHIKMHKTSVAKSGNWFKTIVLIGFAAIVAFMFVNSKAALSEVSTEISSMTSQLQEAKSENVRLQAQLDNMVTLGKVEEMAVSELGLQKTTKSQVRYISVHDRTMVQVAQQEENVFASLKSWLDGVSEYLGF